MFGTAMISIVYVMFLFSGDLGIPPPAPSPVAVVARSQTYLQVMPDRAGKRFPIGGSSPRCTECEFFEQPSPNRKISPPPMPLPLRTLARMTTSGEGGGGGGRGIPSWRCSTPRSLAHLCESALELPRERRPWSALPPKSDRMHFEVSRALKYPPR